MVLAVQVRVVVLFLEMLNGDYYLLVGFLKLIIGCILEIPFSPLPCVQGFAMCPRIFSMNSRVNIFTPSVDFSQAMNVRGFSPSYIVPIHFQQWFVRVSWVFFTGFPKFRVSFSLKGWWGFVSFGLLVLSWSSSGFRTFI